MVSGSVAWVFLFVALSWVYDYHPVMAGKGEFDMISWIGFALSFAFAVYQHFHPRILSKLYYRIEDIKEDNHPIPLSICDVGDLYGGSGRVNQRHINLIGKAIKLKSSGNIAARGILIHVRLKYPIYRCHVATDEHHGEPYGKYENGELNLKVECLNPTDVLRVLVYCDAEKVQDGENIMLEHRVTLNEGKAKRIRRPFLTPLSSTSPRSAPPSSS